MVLSHQAGVTNAVASSGTAFTRAHLERLRRLSARIILAFDGDKAGDAAAEKAAALALSLGLEVKIAKLPEGRDPADLAKESPDTWKNVLREAKPAVEHFLEQILTSEKDRRRALKMVESKLLPLLSLVGSSMERSHFASLIATRTGVKEEMIWEDLKKAKKPDVQQSNATAPSASIDTVHTVFSKKEKIEERLTEVRTWLKELPDKSEEAKELEKEEKELMGHLRGEELKDELANLSVALSQSETSKDDEGVLELTQKIQAVHKELRNVEEGKKTL